MTTIAILRNTLKLNAVAITGFQNEARWLRMEGMEAKEEGDISMSIELYAKRRKEQAKLAKAVNLQNSVKAEIAHIFRVERIQRKYLQVFGILPNQQVATTIEQEAMLDSLLAEVHVRAKAASLA